MAAGAGAALGTTLLPNLAQASALSKGAPRRVIFFLQNQGFDPATCVPKGLKENTSLAGLTLPEPISPLEPYKDRINIINGLHGLHTSPSHSAFFGALGGYRGGIGVPPMAATIDHVVSQSLPQTILPHLCIGMDSLENMVSRPTLATLSATGPGHAVADSAEFQDDMQRLEHISPSRETKGKDTVIEFLLQARALGSYLNEQYNNPKQALELLDRARELSPGNINEIMERGLAYLGMERWQDALASFERIDPSKRKRLNYMAARAIALYGLGRKTEADALANQALGRLDKKNRLDHLGHKLYAHLVLTRDGNPEPEKVNDPNILEWRGLWLSGRGRWEEAQRDFDRVLELEPERSNKIRQFPWWCIGPYPGGMDDAFPPDEDPDPFRTYDQAPHQWWLTGYNYNQIRFGQLSNACYYVASRVWAAKDREVAMYWGDCDQSRLFFNGELVLETEPNDSSFEDVEYRIPIPLKKGWNTFTAKVWCKGGTQGGLYRWLTYNFDHVRIAREEQAARKSASR